MKNCCRFGTCNAVCGSLVAFDAVAWDQGRQKESRLDPTFLLLEIVRGRLYARFATQNSFHSFFYLHFLCISQNVETINKIEKREGVGLPIFI